MIDNLVAIPKKYNVSNVYADIGLCFGAMAISYPRMCAAFLGKLVEGLGADHVVWGTDSVWFGSPQWQIEALRRLEIPEDLQKKYGFAPLGPANSPVKNAIFGVNAAKLYNIALTDSGQPQEHFEADQLAKLKTDYQKAGPQRGNLYWDWIRKQTSRGE